MTQKKVIDALSSCYKKEKKIALDNQAGNAEYSDYAIYSSKRICDTIERSVSQLKDDDYFIIYNEVIKGKKGKWYEDYYSEASYYRHRNRAYRKYIKKLDV